MTPKFSAILAAIVAAAVLSVSNMVAAADMLVLRSPDGKQTVSLTDEPCPQPGAPSVARLARFETEGVKYDACWAPTPTGVVVVTPPGKPEARDDLAPAKTETI